MGHTYFFLMACGIFLAVDATSISYFYMDTNPIHEANLSQFSAWEDL